MITEHQEIARLRIAEQVRAAETRAQLHEARTAGRSASWYGPRQELATVLRRMADRLEPNQPKRSTGLSVVR
jgi:hypothetical protein